MLFQEIPSDTSPFHLLNFLLLIIYLLSQGLVFLIKRKKDKLNGKVVTINALQIDLEKLEAKVVVLDSNLDKQNIQISNKLDMILNNFDEQKEEFKELQKSHRDLNDRMIRIEEQLKNRRR